MKYSLIGLVTLSVLASSCTKEPSKEAQKNEPVVSVEVTQGAETSNLCVGFGPQTPRDITFRGGKNMASFPLADDVKNLNLCNVHTHTNAEHKGPGFSVFVNDTDNGGYACNETDSLTDAELIEGRYRVTEQMGL